MIKNVKTKAQITPYPITTQFILFLFSSLLFLTNCVSTKQISDPLTSLLPDNYDYKELLTLLKEGDQTVDFFKLRMAFVKTPDLLLNRDKAQIQIHRTL